MAGRTPRGRTGPGIPEYSGNIELLSNIHARCWAPLQTKCGLPGYGFHMLRHAAASLFIQYLGWSPKRLQTVMGHSSIRMTYDLYGHLNEADRADMAKIEAAVRAA